MNRDRLVKSWSRADWERLPIQARPKGVIPVGDSWVLLAEEPPIGPPELMAEFPASESGGESRTERALRREEADA
jgi:hypothetical protein